MQVSLTARNLKIKKRHVQYRLTELGESMEDVIRMIQEWGEMKWLVEDDEE